MKIDIGTPQDQLLKYQKSCGTAFGWLLGIGIVTFPVGIVPIGVALSFLSRKKKAAQLIRLQQAAEAGRKQAEAEARQAQKEADDAQWRAWREYHRELADRLQRDYIQVGHVVDRVVGTTFANGDGSSRRANLLYCCAHQDVKIERFTYQGAPAYAVFSRDGQIGNLPATTAEEISRHGDDLIVTGVILQMLNNDDGDPYSCRVGLDIYRHK